MLTLKAYGQMLQKQVYSLEVVWKNNYAQKTHLFNVAKKNFNVVKTIINHPIFDGLYHPSMVILGMVYYCFNHITAIHAILIF